MRSFWAVFLFVQNGIFVRIVRWGFIFDLERIDFWVRKLVSFCVFFSFLSPPFSFFPLSLSSTKIPRRTSRHSRAEERRGGGSGAGGRGGEGGKGREGGGRERERGQ